MVHRRGSERAREIAPVTDSPHVRSNEERGARVSPCERPFEDGRRCERERSAGSEPCNQGERRVGTDRRTRNLHALVAGSLNPRRRGPRRVEDQNIAATDWHQPQWLAVALSILLLSVADALLTLTLLQHRGVLEENPIMAVLLKGDWAYFAAVKIGLTAAGVVLLTALVRVRAFGRVPVGSLLCGLLVVYVGLVGYEVWLLQSVAGS
jgi:hypothetical protein